MDTKKLILILLFLVILLSVFTIVINLTSTNKTVEKAGANGNQANVGFAIESSQKSSSASVSLSVEG